MHRIESGWRRLRNSFNRGHFLSRLLGLPVSHGSPMRHGLVLIQVDGLSYKRLQQALDKGQLPFLKRLMEREHYSLNALYSGLPASTPAVQAELFYGKKTSVPAFAYFNRDTGTEERMYEPTVAAKLEAQLQQQGFEGLLKGGSSYSNIFSGAAGETRFCAPSLGWRDSILALKPFNLAVLILSNLMSVLRMLALLVIELLLAVMDFLRGLVNGHNFVKELKFIPTRVGVSILLREICVIGAKIDISRGLPIIHMNFLGYDEQAHRRGPDSAFALWTLKGIDYAIKRVWRDAMRATRRDYAVWIYSDHGQCTTIAYHRQQGYSLHHAVASVYADTCANNNANNNANKYANNHTNNYANNHTNSYAGNYAARWMWPANLAQSPQPSHTDAVEDKFRIAALGPVGFVYFTDPPASGELAVMARKLVDEHRIPAVIVNSPQGQLTAYSRSGVHELPADTQELCGSDHPYLDFIRHDLAALCRHADAGELILLGWVKGSDTLTFATENGSHAGISEQETGAFALFPDHVPLQLNSRSAIRPADIREAALSFLGRLRKGSAAQSSTAPDRTAGSLRVMTYNTHSCIGTDGKLSPERIARVISHFEPDIVALQELDVRRPRTRGQDQAEIIAELLEMQYHFHPAIHLQEERYGNAILTHLPLQLERSAILPKHDSRFSREPRGVLSVMVDYQQTRIQVMNTHFGLSAQERQSQAEFLTGEEWLGIDNNSACILCGDFNAVPGSAAWRTLNRALRDVQLALPGHRSRGTFYSRFPWARIDHIFIDTGFQVDRVQVPKSLLTRLASDHLPLIVDLRLTSEITDQPATANA